MNTSHKPQASWSADIVSMAKWSLFLGVLLYAHWILVTIQDFDGIISRKGTGVIGGDFINYWSAARLALDHHIMTLFDLDGFRQAQHAMLGLHGIVYLNNWSYPPFFVLWILWLGFFPYSIAFGLWLAATFALYAFAVAYKRPLAWGVALILLFAPASAANVNIGQNGFLSAALLVGGLRLMPVRPILAGIALGLLCYKPQLGLLIPLALIASRQWTVFAFAALTVLLQIGGSILVFGLDPWRDYISMTIPYQQGLLRGDIHSLYTRMMPTPFMAARILGFPAAITFILASLAAAGAAWAVIYAFTRPKIAVAVRNAVLLTATFLAAPYGFFYDMTILSAGVIDTVEATGSSPRPLHLVLFIVAWFLPLFVFPLNQDSLPVAPLVMAALLAFQLRLIRARATSA